MKLIIVSIMVRGKVYTRCFSGRVFNGKGRINDSDFKAWLTEIGANDGTTISFV